MNADQISILQSSQQSHDVLAHWDIVVLPIDRRIKHLALHFAKYVGKLVALDESLTHAGREVVVDISIISLSLANSLNLDLKSGSDSDIEIGVGAAILGESGLNRQFLKEFAQSTGRIAKALESLDHLEDFPYRKCLEAEAKLIFCLCLRFSKAAGFNLEEKIRARWIGIENSRRFRNGAAAS